jgi:hypothetical protein
MLERARATIADFEAREGKPPDPLMTLGQIEEAVRQASLKAFAMPTIPNYLLSGLVGKPLGSGQS